MRQNWSILFLITAVFMLLTTSVTPHHHHDDHICFAAAEREQGTGETPGNASDEASCPLNTRAALAEKAAQQTVWQQLIAIPVTTLPVVPTDDTAPSERLYAPFAVRVPLVLLTRDNPLRAPPVA